MKSLELSRRRRRPGLGPQRIGGKTCNVVTLQSIWFLVQAMALSNGLGAAAAAVLWGAAAVCWAQAPAALKPYVSEDAQVLVLMHVRVIDGTGAAAAEDQRIDIEGGKI